MGELVPFGKYKDQPIERQVLTAEPVKILYTSNIIELFPHGAPPRDGRYSPQFPRFDCPNVVPLFNRDGWFTLAELGRVPPSIQYRSKSGGSIFDKRRSLRDAVEAAILSGIVGEAALAYARNGFPVFPVDPKTKTPIPARDKDEDGNPIPGTGGHYKATCDEEQIRKWWKRHPNALIGMPMGARTGIWALDIDTGEDHDDGLKAWLKLAAKHPAIVTRQHFSATGGLHLIFIWNAETPIACSSGDLPAGIHVKGMGGYIVVPPSKRKGRFYTVFNKRNIDPIEPPQWLVDLIQGDRQQDAAPNEELAAGEPAKVAYAVSVTPNDLRGWPEWKRYVMAIWSALDGDADALSDIVHKFSKSWTLGEYDAAFTDKCLSEVCGCPPDRIGAGTVYRMADQAHPEWRSEYDIIVARRLGETLSFRKEREAKSKPPAAPNEKLKAISLQDFVAHLPGSTITYIYLPTREHWGADAVDTQLPSMPVLKKNGKPVLDGDGRPKKIKASSWLDKNRSVQQMTWTPAEPMLIVDKLIADGGWFDKPKATCLNLYRPPRIKPGDATKAGPWVELVQKIYPEDHAHLFKYFAQRRQRPGDKINHALMLGGPPGIGKDTILAALKQAVGPWNFSEISPHNLFEPFNPHIKSVVLRISEARDLGDVNRYALLEHTKTLMAAPPDVLRCNEKNLRQYYIVNVTGVIITTNHKTDGIYLPADDRRHFVAWSPLTKEDFAPAFWKTFWHWYEHGGYEHVAAWLDEYDLSGFDCKAPPPKTAAWWDIVTANRPAEEGELADVLDKLGNPDAVTFNEIYTRAAEIDISSAKSGEASSVFSEWLADPKNRKQFSYRMEDCGYVPVRNEDSKQGLWQIGGERKVIYAKAELSMPDRLKAVKAKITADEDKARIRAKAKAEIAGAEAKEQRNNKNSNDIKLTYE